VVRTERSVAREVVAFAVATTAVLLAVGVVGVVVLRWVGTTEAIREAKRLTQVAALGVVQPRLDDGILRGEGDIDSQLRIDTIVNGAVVRDPIVRVKIWDPIGSVGRIVYASTPELVGSSFALDAGQLDALRTDEAVSETSDPALPQNASERDLGPLLNVSIPVTTPGGHELLFEASIRSGSVSANAHRLWISFLPVLALALIALTALQLPLMYRVARRVRRSQADRERFLQRAIDSSDLERRRIAADLHDGSVQQLAGVSMSLAASADSLELRDPTASRTLRDAATATRLSVRSLRSAVMGIYPPDLQRAGLRAGLTDLTATLVDDDVHADVRVPAELMLPLEVESLLFRASREAIRNIATHAHARTVRLDVRRTGRTVTLEVVDDGVGFTPAQGEDARANGHLGLKLIADLAGDVGGSLVVDSRPGRGTVVRLEVPVP
jgi:two-component system, NarL family, sensor kinase